MNNKKQLDLCLSCLFGFTVLNFVTTLIFKNNGHSGFKSWMMFSGIWMLLMALPTAYISFKNVFSKKSVGKVGALMTASALIVYAINYFHRYSNPFRDSIFGVHGGSAFLIVDFILGIGGILFLIDSRAWRWIKIFGVSMFVSIIAKGYLVFLIFQRSAEVYDYDSYVSRVQNLQIILGVVSILYMLTAAVALILTIVSLCKRSEDDEYETTVEEEVTEIEDNTNKYELYEQTVVVDEPEEDFEPEETFKAVNVSEYPSKVILGPALLSLFGFFVMLGYFVNAGIIEPLTRRFGDSISRSDSDSDLPVFVGALMFLAALVTLIVSFNKQLFRKNAGPLFGIFTAILMGICSYCLASFASKTRPDIEPGAIIFSFILLGVCAIVYFACMNIYEGRTLKLFGFASLVSYLVIIALTIIIYNEINSYARSFYYGGGSHSWDYVKDLVNVLKFTGIFCYLMSIISFLGSIFMLFRPTPKTPYEYRL